MIASLAVAISVRVPVARSAQQISSIMTLVLAWLCAIGMRRFGGSISWGPILKIDLILFAIGLVGMIAGMRLFRRDCFFDQR